MCQNIGTCHRIEAWIMLYRIRFCLIPILIKCHTLGVSICLIFRIEQVIDGSSYRDSLCVAGFKGVRGTQVIDEISV